MARAEGGDLGHDVDVEAVRLSQVGQRLRVTDHHLAVVGAGQLVDVTVPATSGDSLTSYCKK
jgi:hypothetical protein